MGKIGFGAEGGADSDGHGGMILGLTMCVFGVQDRISNAAAFPAFHEVVRRIITVLQLIPFPSKYG